MSTPEPSLSGLERAVDAALVQALKAPPLPSDFRTRLTAALARAHDPVHSAQTYERLQREQALALAKLEADYLRLRRRTLAGLIGGAFAAGAAAAVAMPYLMAHWGPVAVVALPVVGAIVGIGIAAGALTRVRLHLQ